MTLEELKQSGHILFECISGSRAYGLATPASDTDIRGVFVLPKDQFYGLNPIDQVSNASNDIVYYELRKFIELCAGNNPNILELLNVPEACITHKHPLFDSIRPALFLSKRCETSFANYAYSQIKKARGLEKKIVNPVEKERKSVLEFCFVHEDGKSMPLAAYLEKHGLRQEQCGLSKLPHMKQCYNLFYSSEKSYKGILKNKDANEVTLSSIPKGEVPMATLFFNQDGYSSYCKSYREYWEWVEKRNDHRYANTIAHGKNYDSKNMMHTFRLLHMAREIAVEGQVLVKRPDRDYLLAIKDGHFEYDELVERAEVLKAELEKLYIESSLPDAPDLNRINELLVSIRNAFYEEREQPEATNTRLSN